MPRAFSKIRKALLPSTVVGDAGKNTRKRVDEDNRKMAGIWSVVEIAFWILCLVMSINDPAFEQCRSLYIVALALSVVTFVLAVFVAPKVPKLVRPLVAAMQIILIGAGIGIAFFQPAVRSATFIAAVLIVPVMFVSEIFPILVYEVVGIVLFATLGPAYIVPEVFSWTLKSLIIFSIAGLLIGYIINKARFERYAFEESALELAELRNKFAYYDQLTDLPNRRAYSERIEKLGEDMPAECCVVTADINGLKQVNDTYGHSAGDELIIGAAKCLSASFEGVGDVYRLGGDEFCVITSETEEDIEQRLLRMEQMAADWKGELVEGVSISYGVAAARDYKDIETVLRAADRKMYEYKRNYYAAAGRDRRHFSSEPFSAGVAPMTDSAV